MTTETAETNSCFPMRDERTADERDIESKPFESIENSERIAETLTLRSSDRAIGPCVTELKSADVDLCAPAGGRRVTINCPHARLPCFPKGSILSPKSEIKEVGLADLTGNRITIPNFGGDYDDWSAERCDEPTRDMIIQPKTDRFPRGGAREQSGHEEGG